MISLLLMASVVLENDVKVDYADISEVRKHYAASKGQITDWLKDSTARGSSFKSVYTETTDWYDAETKDFLYRDVFQSVYSISRSGTVVALPVDNWSVEEEFSYYGEGKKILKGMLVTVKVKICAPNATKLPAAHQCNQTVKNLAESGMAIPKSAGKGGHLQPLKRLAKQRFGASNVDVIYDGCKDCRLKFLLFGCNEKIANKHVRTMMFDGERPTSAGKNPVEENHQSEVENFGRDREPDLHKRARQRTTVVE